MLFRAQRRIFTRENVILARWVHSKVTAKTIDLAHPLQLNSVKPLPHRDTVPLVWHEFKHSKKFEYKFSKPIVLLHGLFGSLSNYRSVGRRLSHLTSRPIYGIDLRNHGDSPHAQPFDYETLANDVVKLMKQENWTGATLIGHSMGAKTAMIVALKLPELVSQLIVVDNAPVAAQLDPQFHNDLIGLAHVQHSKFEPNTPLSQMLSKARTIIGPYEPDHLVQTFLLSNLRASATGSNLRIPALEMLKYDIIRDMGSWPNIHATYPGPTFIMHAKYSPFVTEANLQVDFPQYFSNFKLKQYDCGHWIVSERPEEFVKDVIQCIS